MRLIDADKLYPDCLTKTGRLAISQSQIADAPTVEQSYQEPKDYIRNKLDYSRPQGDLISRSALRKDIERLYSVYKDNKDYFYTDVLDHIDNAPTVEIPTGEWINREAVSNTTFPFWERYECNQCHKYNGYSNFCPNCGADMRGGIQ